MIVQDIMAESQLFIKLIQVRFLEHLQFSWLQKNDFLGEMKGGYLANIIHLSYFFDLDKLEMTGFDLSNHFVQSNKDLFLSFSYFQF